MNRLYMIQRWATTSSLTKPASSRIATAADTTTPPRTTSEGARNRRVVTSAIALMNLG